jgi:hypothetical protein
MAEHEISTARKTEVVYLCISFYVSRSGAAFRRPGGHVRIDNRQRYAIGVATFSCLQYCFAWPLDAPEQCVSPVLYCLRAWGAWLLTQRVREELERYDRADRGARCGCGCGW